MRSEKNVREGIFEYEKYERDRDTNDKTKKNGFHGTRTP